MHGVPSHISASAVTSAWRLPVATFIGPEQGRAGAVPGVGSFPGCLQRREECPSHSDAHCSRRIPASPTAPRWPVTRHETAVLPALCEFEEARHLWRTSLLSSTHSHRSSKSGPSGNPTFTRPLGHVIHRRAMRLTPNHRWSHGGGIAPVACGCLQPEEETHHDSTSRRSAR